MSKVTQLGAMVWGRDRAQTPWPQGVMRVDKDRRLRLRGPHGQRKRC